MTMPDRIWATDDAKNFGQDAFFSKSAFRKGTPYLALHGPTLTAAHRALHDLERHVSMQAFDEFSGSDRFKSQLLLEKLEAAQAALRMLEGEG